MPITITTADVKRKAMIQSTDSTYDADIAALIAEMQPAMEREIAPEYLNDTSDAGLQAILKLGMLEVMAGEFLEQMMREKGAGESFAAGGVTIGPPIRTGPDLMAQGKARLAPYLSVSMPISNTLDVQSVFNKEEEVW